MPISNDIKRRWFTWYTQIIIVYRVLNTHTVKSPPTAKKNFFFTIWKPLSSINAWRTTTIKSKSFSGWEYSISRWIDEGYVWRSRTSSNVKGWSIDIVSFKIYRISPGRSWYSDNFLSSSNGLVPFSERWKFDLQLFEMKRGKKETNKHSYFLKDSKRFWIWVFNSRIDNCSLISSEVIE